MWSLPPDGAKGPDSTGYSSDVPDDIRQLHSSGYRNAGELPAGAVLVVGSGASGFQIAEDLHQYGRQVYLCVGRHRPLARRYRGRDYAWWAMEMGMFERQRTESSATSAPGPLLTGVNGGYQADVRALASKGIILLGRLKAVAGARLVLALDLEENLAKGEEWLANYKKSVDDYIAKNKLNFPEESPPANLSPVQKGSTSTPILELDLRAAGITSIIWATGFGNDYDWLKLSGSGRARGAFARARRHAVSRASISRLRWLYKQKSGFLSFGGPAEDADYLAEQIVAKHSQSSNRSS